MSQKAYIPIYVTVTVRDQAHALELKRKLEGLLKNPMLRTFLAGSQIQADAIVAGEPAPLPQ
jgi:hypothetical protein